METRSNERKWTPGPWLVSKEFTLKAFKAGVTLRLWSSRKCADADAHLIAAAPDLYEALEQARDTIRELINARSSEAEGSDEDWVGGINAALAKARGEK